MGRKDDPSERKRPLSPPAEHKSDDGANRPRNRGDAHRTDAVDRVFSCLADHQRRVLIDSLAEHSGAVEMEQLVQHLVEHDDGAGVDESSRDRAERIATSLIHVHLPKLHQAEVIAMGDGQNVVRPGERFDTAKNLLDEL